SSKKRIKSFNNLFWGMYFFLKAYSNPKKSSRKLHYEIIMHNSIIIFISLPSADLISGVFYNPGLKLGIQFGKTADLLLGFENSITASPPRANPKAVKPPSISQYSIKFFCLKLKGRH